MSLTDKILKEAGGLNESMDLFVANTPEKTDLDGILSICQFIHKAVYRDYLPNVKDKSVAQQASEALRGPLVFAPDGSDAFEETGTINLYTRGKFPMSIMQHMLSFIKYILKENNIEIGQTKLEREGQQNEVVRIPVVSNGAVDQDPEPSINLSNENMKMMFCDVLNMDEEFDHGSVGAADLKMRIEMVRDLPTSHPEASGMSQKTNKNGDKMNYYEFEPGQDYIQRTLDAFETLAAWALERGYTMLHIG